jgi:hypothetical protein
MSDIVERLRNTPNWLREEFGSWKSAMRSYDRAPFEAADEIEKLRELLRPFIYTGNVEIGFRIGQNPPPITASDEEALEHYAGDGVYFLFWRQWRAVQIGRELLGEKE